ncbi:uncharacterized protein C7orf26 homolog [Nilaparvata lugens]|uniref:uncharacterized protein C7orf26 homolog n=1 Tax=Nilaparvata lugens TaxID=108931 RepID=UPI00193C9C9A|nr:uncharacterized protein C7orf26 homolog [Nilaparvata lugens]XP_022192128.2 uncharacterized protein C7orf26 homolog [Nilaparvata lugens]
MKSIKMKNKEMVENGFHDQMNRANIKSQNDIKSALRKLDFPFCTKEALGRIEQLLAIPNSKQSQGLNARANNHYPHPHQPPTDLINEIIQEFVFCEIDRRGKPCKQPQLSCLRELQLLEVLSDYVCSSIPARAARNAVFMSLFNPMHPDRGRILVKLVSMAISINNHAALMATAILMQQQSCTSKFSIQLAQGVVNDFIVLYPDCIDKLRELPVSCPLFCANFMTAVTEIYGIALCDKNEIPQWVGVPEKLITVIIEWVEKFGSQLVSSLSMDFQSFLPTGAIVMAAVAPYSGLLKWTILSSLHEKNTSAQNLYLDLHLAVCNSLYLLPDKRPEYLITAVDLISIIHHIKKCIISTVSEEKLDDCLIRLAQSVQVAMHSKAVYGNWRTLLEELQSLPQNRIMSIVINFQKTSI